jgi:hypothetical protein
VLKFIVAAGCDAVEPPCTRLRRTRKAVSWVRMDRQCGVWDEFGSGAKQAAVGPA